MTLSVYSFDTKNRRNLMCKFWVAVRGIPPFRKTYADCRIIILTTKFYRNNVILPDLGTVSSPSQRMM